MKWTARTWSVGGLIGVVLIAAPLGLIAKGRYLPYDSGLGQAYVGTIRSVNQSAGAMLDELALLYETECHRAITIEEIKDILRSELGAAALSWDGQPIAADLLRNAIKRTGCDAKV